MGWYQWETEEDFLLWLDEANYIESLPNNVAKNVALPIYDNGYIKSIVDEKRYPLSIQLSSIGYPSDPPELPPLPE